MEKGEGGIIVLLILQLILAIPQEGASLEAPGPASILEVGGEYPTISSAIGNASAGDVIKVPAGIFYERLIIYWSLTIRGAGANVTFIDGSDLGSTITVLADHVTIADLTVQNSGTGEVGANEYDSGITVKGDHLSIMNCTFLNNSRVGISFITSGSRSMIHNCTFHGPAMNHIRVSSDEITHLSVIDCAFINNGYQLVFYSPDLLTNIVIMGNEFVNTDPENFLSTVIVFPFRGILDSLFNATIAGNRFRGGVNGVYLNGGVGVDVSYNTFDECTEHGITVSTTKDTTIHHNNFLRSGSNRSLGYNEDARVDWNDSKGSGNYWSNYGAVHPNATNDGTCWDEPYPIDGDANASDLHPLVHPVAGTIVPAFAPVISLPGETIDLRCGQGFEIPFWKFDPDTPIYRLRFYAPSGWEWITCTGEGVLRGRAPDKVAPGSYELNLTVSDGEREVSGTLMVRMLPKAELIGRWNMSGTDWVLDSSGHGRNGTLKGGAMRFRGINGTGVFMDGKGDGIEMNGFGSDSPHITIAFCIYPISRFPENEYVLTLGTYPLDDISMSIGIDWRWGGKMTFSSVGPGDVMNGLNSMDPIPRDEWTWVALTYDGEYGSFYLNGEIDNTAAMDLMFPENTTLVLGDIGDYSGFMGVMDEVSIYNQVLPPEELQAMYSSLAPGSRNYPFPGELNGSMDRDRDNLSDGWEIDHFSDIDMDPEDDPDGDGYDNAEESRLGSDPMDSDDPRIYVDSDRDRLMDEWEIRYFGDLHQRWDMDPDKDGYSNLDEFDLGSDPTDRNDPTMIRDSDSLPDEWELMYFGDLDEGPNGDYDGDGFTNREEYEEGTDPTDSGDHPFIISNWCIILLIALAVVAGFMIAGGFFLFQSMKNEKKGAGPGEE